MSFHRQLSRAIPVSQRFVARPQARLYAAQNATNARNPISSSPESQAINDSRGKESRSADTADTRSTQSPISPNRRGYTSEAHEGEEETSFNEHIMNDPKEPAEVKRRKAEQAGEKSMGPEDRTG